MTKKKLHRSNKLVFNQALHKYYFEGKELLSVTNFIKTFDKEFNPLFASIGVAKSNTKKKKGITDARGIRKLWRLHGERKRCIGTAAHAFAEMRIMDRTVEPITGYDKAVIKALEALSKNWDIVGAEQRVYSTTSYLAGTYDLKLKHKTTGVFAMVDWKVTEDMFKGYNKLKGVFKDLKATALVKYFIQLNIYALLDKDIINEDKLFVIQLKNDGTFNAYTIKDIARSVRDDVVKVIKSRVVDNHPLLNM